MGPARRRHGVRTLALLAVVIASLLTFDLDGMRDPTRSVPTARSPAPPDASNTGVPAGTKLKVITHNVTIRKAGAVYDGYDFRGFVSVEAPHVTIRNSRFAGGRATGHRFWGLIQNLHAHTGLVVTDSEIAAAHPSYWIEGLKGGNVTGIRLNIHDVADGVKILGNNVTLRDSYIHHLSYFANDPNYHNTPTHVDGVQIVSGHHIRLIHNTILGGYNSAVQVTQDHGTVGDLRITRNRIGGGACSVNIAAKPLGRFSGVMLKSNRFYHTSTFNCPIIIDANISYRGVGNRWVDRKKFTVVKRAIK